MAYDDEDPLRFSDRLRAWFKGETKRARTDPTTDRASRGGTKELEDFIRTRVGVEGYLEPKTAIYSTTLLLVADDGEYLRRPVKDQGQAAALCARTNIPFYDARRVGYPRRMKDYDRGVRPERVSLDDLPPWPGDAPARPDGPPPPPDDPPLEPPSDRDAGSPDEATDPPPPAGSDEAPDPHDPPLDPGPTDRGEDRPPDAGPTDRGGDPPPDVGPTSGR